MQVPADPGQQIGPADDTKPDNLCIRRSNKNPRTRLCSTTNIENSAAIDSFREHLLFARRSRLKPAARKDRKDRFPFGTEGCGQNVAHQLEGKTDWASRRSIASLSKNARQILVESLAFLCVLLRALCVSVVEKGAEIIDHGDTESTEISN